MGNDPARLPRQIVDDVFILNFENPVGQQDAMPICHQRLVGAVVPPELRQIVSKVLFGGEQLGKTGKARVNWISRYMDDRRIWQRQVNKTKQPKISWHFIDRALCSWRKFMDLRQVARTEILKIGAGHCSNRFREMR